MSKKNKGLIFKYATPVSAPSLASSKHQTLVQEYKQLQQESDVMRSKLLAAEHKKLTLAAEVRFLRRRCKLLAESKTMKALQAEKLAQTPKSYNQMKTKNSQVLSGHHKLPPKPVAKLNKKCYAGEQSTTPSTSSPNNDHQKKLRGGKKSLPQNLTPTSVFNYKGRINTSHKMFAWKVPVADLNQERIQSPNDTAMNKSTVAFDLNQDSSASGKQSSLPTRTPIFDLNEISTGDEDFQINVEALKFDEAKKSFISGLNEQQNDLMLSMCRNAGEGSSSCMGKQRKMSWQDPVVLRV